MFTPVSYTHLDVYKRQHTHTHTHAFNKKLPQGRLSIDFLELLRDNETPVYLGVSASRHYPLRSKVSVDVSEDQKH